MRAELKRNYGIYSKSRKIYFKYKHKLKKEKLVSKFCTDMRFEYLSNKMDLLCIQIDELIEQIVFEEELYNSILFTLADRLVLSENDLQKEYIKEYAYLLSLTTMPLRCEDIIKDFIRNN